MPGAFKLDPFQPIEPILFQKIFKFFIFILGGQFLLPQGANSGKGDRIGGIWTICTMDRERELWREIDPRKGERMEEGQFILIGSSPSLLPRSCLPPSIERASRLLVRFHRPTRRACKPRFQSTTSPSSVTRRLLFS